MVDAAANDVKTGKRARTPSARMAPCILSHLGEMSPSALHTVEFITLEYRNVMSTRAFEDGIPLKRRTAQFRTRFKDAIMCANVSGFGTTISQAGPPHAGASVTSDDACACSGLPEWEVLY